MDKWIKKMRYVYTMEYYSAVKKNEIMPFAATWIDLEMIIISEVGRKRKTGEWGKKSPKKKKKRERARKTNTI